MKSRFSRIIIVLSLLVAFFTIGRSSATAQSGDIALDKAPESFGIDLASALKSRKSDREYTDKEITREDLSKILWAANGINRDNGKRTAPTPRGFYLVKIYVFSRTGAYFYEPTADKLIQVSGKNFMNAVGKQPYVGSASQILAMTADLKEYKGDSPREEKINLAWATAGCISQNVYLAAAALKIGTCFVYSAEGPAIREALQLKKEEVPLMIMPLGYLKK